MWETAEGEAVCIYGLLNLSDGSWASYAKQHQATGSPL